MVAFGGSFPSASRGNLVLFFLKATTTVVFAASVVVVFSSSARGAFGRRRLEESRIHRDDAFIGYSERSSSSKSSSVPTCVDESLMCPQWAANGACDSTTTRTFMTQNCCCGAYPFFLRTPTPTPTTRDFTPGTLTDDVLTT